MSLLPLFSFPLVSYLLFVPASHPRSPLPSPTSKIPLTSLLLVPSFLSRLPVSISLLTPLSFFLLPPCFLRRFPSSNPSFRLHSLPLHYLPFQLFSSFFTSYFCLQSPYTIQSLLMRLLKTLSFSLSFITFKFTSFLFPYPNHDVLPSPFLPFHHTRSLPCTRSFFPFPPFVCNESYFPYLVSRPSIPLAHLSLHPIFRLPLLLPASFVSHLLLPHFPTHHAVPFSISYPPPPLLLSLASPPPTLLSCPSSYSSSLFLSSFPYHLIPTKLKCCQPLAP